MSESNDILNRPACTREDAAAVLSRLRDSGHVAYFAGGCVRGLLMGMQPKDYDVATDAPPQRVRELFRNTQAVGAAFGVILVRQGKSVVEVATFRREGKYLDGRHPSEVQFTTAEQDAQRRDFTINGLFLDPTTNHVIDYVGGQEDLSKRQLRAIGEPAHRFEEDHLRLLRAVRFAARFELTIEEKTAHAIADHAAHLKHISPERIADELRRMLMPPTRDEAWGMLWRFGLVHEIFRFFAPVPGTRFEAGRSILAKLRPDSEEPIPFSLALAGGALCYTWQSTGKLALEKHSIQKAVRAMRQALKISNEESAEMETILRDAGMLLADAEPTVAAMKRMLGRATSTGTRELLDAIAAIGQHEKRIGWLRERLGDLEKTEVAPLPLLNGDDLTAMGFAPGPIFKIILDGVYDAQLEGGIATRDEAVAMAKSLAAAQ
jgi:poly(A) polymerase